MVEMAELRRATTHNHGPFNAAVAKYVEKLEQPDPRVAAAGFREKARGVGYVIKCLGIAGLLILLGLAVVLWQHERKEAAAANTESLALPKLPGVDQPAPPERPETGKTKPLRPSLITPSSIPCRFLTRLVWSRGGTMLRARVVPRIINIAM